MHYLLESLPQQPINKNKSKQIKKIIIKLNNYRKQNVPMSAIKSDGTIENKRLNIYIDCIGKKIYFKSDRQQAIYLLLCYDECECNDNGTNNKLTTFLSDNSVNGNKAEFIVWYKRFGVKIMMGEECELSLMQYRYITNIFCWNPINTLKNWKYSIINDFFGFAKFFESQ